MEQQRTTRREMEDADLADLLRTFYDELDRDPILGHYFAELDMSAHIPRIADFWSTILFGTKRYVGNAFAPHLRLEGLGGEHFARWVETLERVVDARYRGRAAEEMKQTAHRIAYSMQLRLGIAPFESYRSGT